MTNLPPKPLIVLRCVATVLLSCVIGQAGWAAAFLGGDDQYREHHEIGALVTVVVAVLSAVVYLVMRRWAGVVNVSLAVVLGVAVVVQYLLGEGHQVSVHIFSGVLIAMLATALTSWTYRHQLAEA